MPFPWDELQVFETNDEREIRRAYAKRLKIVHPEDNPEGFQRLRKAYEYALLLASFRAIDEIGDTGLSTADSSRAVDPVVLLERDSLAIPNPTIPQRAREVIGSIVEAYKRVGNEGALETLQGVLGSEEFENIEFQLRFEEILAEELIAQESPAYELWGAVSGRFAWDGYHSNYTIQRLVERLDAWREYRNLLQRRDSRTIRSGSISLKIPFVTPIQARAADMLTSPFNLWKFRKNYNLFPGLTEAVQAQMTRLQLHSPLTIEEFLDAKTVEWWNRRPPNPINVIPWVIVGAIVAVFFVVNNDLLSGAWAISAVAIFLLLVAVWANSRYRFFEIVPRKFVLAGVMVVIVGGLAVLLWLSGFAPGGLFFVAMLIRGLMKARNREQ